jgi:pyruvate/2-oxoglutarate dehydrogenase complex dihydrolipoamide dehydrogenase (E3) component
MAIGDYDLVVIGYGSRAMAIALKASRLKARVALVPAVNLVNYWDRSKVEQIIRQVRLAPHALLSVLESLQPLEDLEFLQSSGVDVVIGEGEFSDRQTFLVNQTNSQNSPKSNLNFISGRKLRSRRFVIVKDQPHPVWKIVGLNEIEYLTYDSLFDLLRKLRGKSGLGSLSSLTIVGGNSLNCAIAQLLNRLGVKVQILAESRILPEFELDIARILQAHLEIQGIEILTGSIVTAVSDQKIWVNAASGIRTLALNGHILIPTFSYAKDLNFPRAEIKVNDDEILINSKLQTTNPQIYLCRNLQDIDIILKNSLFLPIATSKSLLPSHISLTTPEIASIGLTEIEARLRYGKDLYILQTPIYDLKFYKVLYRGNGEIVGAHFIGDRSEELLTAIAIMMHQKLKVFAVKGIEGGAINAICQEISTNILIKNLAKNWKSLWFKLFSW